MSAAPARFPRESPRRHGLGESTTSNESRRPRRSRVAESGSARAPRHAIRRIRRARNRARNCARPPRWGDDERSACAVPVRVSEASRLRRKHHVERIARSSPTTRAAKSESARAPRRATRRIPRPRNRTRDWRRPRAAASRWGGDERSSCAVPMRIFRAEKRAQLRRIAASFEACAAPVRIRVGVSLKMHTPDKRRRPRIWADPPGYRNSPALRELRYSRCRPHFKSWRACCR